MMLASTPNADNGTSTAPSPHPDPCSEQVAAAPSPAGEDPHIRATTGRAHPQVPPLRLPNLGDAIPAKNVLQVPVEVSEHGRHSSTMDDSTSPLTVAALVKHIQAQQRLHGGGLGLGSPLLQYTALQEKVVYDPALNVIQIASPPPSQEARGGAAAMRDQTPANAPGQSGQRVGCLSGPRPCAAAPARANGHSRSTKGEPEEDGVGVDVGMPPHLLYAYTDEWDTTTGKRVRKWIDAVCEADNRYYGGLLLEATAATAHDSSNSGSLYPAGEAAIVDPELSPTVKFFAEVKQREAEDAAAAAKERLARQQAREERHRRRKAAAAATGGLAVLPQTSMLACGPSPQQELLRSLNLSGSFDAHLNAASGHGAHSGNQVSHGYQNRPSSGNNRSGSGFCCFPGNATPGQNVVNSSGSLPWRSGSLLHGLGAVPAAGVAPPPPPPESPAADTGLVVMTSARSSHLTQAGRDPTVATHSGPHHAPDGTVRGSVESGRALAAAPQQQPLEPPQSSPPNEPSPHMLLPAVTEASLAGTSGSILPVRPLGWQNASYRTTGAWSRDDSTGSPLPAISGTPGATATATAAAKAAAMASPWSAPQCLVAVPPPATMSTPSPPPMASTHQHPATGTLSHCSSSGFFPRGDEDSNAPGNALPLPTSHSPATGFPPASASLNRSQRRSAHNNSSASYNHSGSFSQPPLADSVLATASPTSPGWPRGVASSPIGWGSQHAPLAAATPALPQFARRPPVSLARLGTAGTSFWSLMNHSAASTPMTAMAASASFASSTPLRGRRPSFRQMTSAAAWGADDEGPPRAHDTVTAAPPSSKEPDTPHTSGWCACVPSLTISAPNRPFIQEAVHAATPSSPPVPLSHSNHAHGLWVAREGGALESAKPSLATSAAAALGMSGSHEKSGSAWAAGPSTPTFDGWASRHHSRGDDTDELGGCEVLVAASPLPSYTRAAPETERYPTANGSVGSAPNVHPVSHLNLSSDPTTPSTATTLVNHPHNHPNSHSTAPGAAATATNDLNPSVSLGDSINISTGHPFPPPPHAHPSHLHHSVSERASAEPSLARDGPSEGSPTGAWADTSYSGRGGGAGGGRRTGGGGGAFLASLFRVVAGQPAPPAFASTRSPSDSALHPTSSTIASPALPAQVALSGSPSPVASWGRRLPTPTTTTYPVQMNLSLSSNHPNNNSRNSFPVAAPTGSSGSQRGTPLAAVVAENSANSGTAAWPVSFNVQPFRRPAPPPPLHRPPSRSTGDPTLSALAAARGGGALNCENSVNGVSAEKIYMEDLEQAPPRCLSPDSTDDGLGCGGEEKGAAPAVRTGPADGACPQDVSSEKSHKAHAASDVAATPSQPWRPPLFS